MCCTVFKGRLPFFVYICVREIQQTCCYCVVNRKFLTDIASYFGNCQLLFMNTNLWNLVPK
jgi:hypothetical protein